MTGTAPARPRASAPLYAAGFVTAFGAHGIAANLGGYRTAGQCPAFPGAGEGPR